ncbi:MAG TPA: hypothetical protein VGL19_10370 [Polyangiaceae bacterium]
MSQTRRFSAKSGFFLGFIGLTTSLACSSSFTSRGDTAGASGHFTDAGSAATANDAGASSEAGAHTGGTHAGGAPSAGAHSGGASAGESSGGGAGGLVNIAGGGASAGGTSGHGGAGGKGGMGGSATGGQGSTCPPECLVAVQCVDHCGGTVKYTGCCCMPPLVDKKTCASPG